jgi:hypothetical protein
MDTIREDFVEHLVKRKDPVYWKLLLVVSGICTALSLMVALVNLFGILIFIGLSVVTYFIWLNSSVEYEYLYIEGEFSVDRILHKNTRKKMVDARPSDLILCGPENNDDVKYNRNGAKLVDVSGDCNPRDRYCYIFQLNGQKICMLFEMTDKLKKQIKYYSPSKFKEY